MANAVTGDTTPNYFKEILVFLYARFGNAEYYAPKEIFTTIDFTSKEEKDKNRLKNILIFFNEDIFNTSKKSFAYNDHHNAYSLNIKGFEFCQRHKEYLGIKD